MFKVEAAPRELSFGRRGERGEQYQFDFSAWADELPGGGPGVTVILPYTSDVVTLGAAQAVVDGTTLTVKIDTNLTLTAGRGTMVIRYVVDGHEKRSRTIDFTVEESHAPSTGAAPDPITDWVSGATAKLAEVDHFVDETIDATEAANAAALRAENGEDAREQAEGLRVIAEQGRNDAYGLAESARDGLYEAAEIAREQLFESAEGLRAGAEISRNTAEGLRDDAETARKEAEVLRVAAEAARMGFKPMGAYNPANENKYGEWYTHEGGSYGYIWPEPSTGVPLTDTSHWQQIASQGATGPSAYDAAHDAGYGGTEAEFNTAMAGLPGATQGALDAAELVNVKTDTLFAQILTPENYTKTMIAFFAANNAAELEDLSDLCERWFRLSRTGWEGGTQFWNTDKSTLSTGTKIGDNSGMVCVPSTNDAHNQDDYESINLFRPFDCNFFVDSAGKRHISAIKGIDSALPFVDNNITRPVGVLQMAPWIKWEQDADTYSLLWTDKERESGYVPVQQAIDLDGTVHSWVVHAKYPFGDGNWSSVSNVPLRRYDVSHNSQITGVRGAFSSQYCGKSAADDSWIKMLMYIKYASLTLDGIMNGCNTYYWTTPKTPALAETGVRRVVLTNADANYVVIGSSIAIGNPGALYTDSKALIGAIVYSAKVLSKEAVDVGGVAHTALNLDLDAAVDITTDLAVNVMAWRTGSTNEVQGNDGSPVSNTSSKDVYKIQGIEMMHGAYEVIGDAILQYSNDGSKNVLKANVCRDASKIATSLNANYRASSYSADCPEASGWTYIKRHGKDDDLLELMLPSEVGGSSATYTRDGAYILAASSGVYEWLSLGSLNSGLASAGASCLAADYGLSNTYWNIGGRLSPNGNRGEFAA